MQNPDSVTGAYLSGRIKIPVPTERKQPTGWLRIRGAAENNLKQVNVDIPLGVMTSVTGVSGSGKSSLINEVLYKTLARDLNRARTIPGKHKEIQGLDQLDKVINIDQSPIGRTPRSNPATYTGVFDQIRDLFAATADAKARGYKKGRFSFNVKGGRCEACSGDGIIKIEMHFLADVYVPCEVCKGKRYNRETLEVKYKDNLINAYDNSIRYTDNFLVRLIDMLREQHVNSALIYTSDHGEDISMTTGISFCMLHRYLPIIRYMCHSLFGCPTTTGRDTHRYWSRTSQ